MIAASTLYNKLDKISGEKVYQNDELVNYSLPQNERKQIGYCVEQPKDRLTKKPA